MMGESSVSRKQEVLQRKIARLDAVRRRRERQNARWTRVRLVALGAGALVSVGLFALSDWAGWIGVALTVGGLLLAGRPHGRVRESLARVRLWKALVEEQQARLRIEWDRLPPPRLPMPGEEHPYAHDLDIVGERSLHRLLDGALTQGGSERLGRWLLEPSLSVKEIEARQALVRELAPRRLFRERLGIEARRAAQAEGPWDERPLLRWLQKHPPRPLGRVVLGLAMLAPLNVVLLALYAAGGLPAYWLLTTLVYIAATYRHHRRLEALFCESMELESLLRRFVVVFRHLEGARYAGCPRLAQLCAPFRDPRRRPSKELQRVDRIAYAASVRRNGLLWFVLNALGPWDLYFADCLERCKQDLRDTFPRWLDAWYELEALSSLAAFADLHPGYAFPRLIEGTRSAGSNSVFQAQGLGHPLIPAERRVCNDFVLESLGEVVLLTGSNASGKSTFLRTLGVNLVLAYAGGPVCARGLQTRLLRVYTCIRVSDSVTEGLSHFYAEVKRLRALLDALLQPDAPHPLFFLIDEIFRATNNRERFLGSRAYIRALVGQNGVGVVTTHDLELVKLAEELFAVRNFHFREEIRDGQMVFDYRLRPGPCPTTNALAIMALEGLPVPEPESTPSSAPSPSLGSQELESLE